MHHVIQENLFTETGYEGLIAAMHEHNLSYSIVKVVPFSHEFSWLTGKNIPEGVDKVIWGSTTMARAAKELNWYPGAFMNDSFDMRILCQRYGLHALNSDANFCTFGTIPAFTGMKFLRPCLDTKSFSGSLIKGEELAVWRLEVEGISDGYTTLNMDTPVLVASPKDLAAEARFFIVNGNVVTGSWYRQGGRQWRKRIDCSNYVPSPIVEFVEERVSEWAPDRAFVLDVAIVAGEYKVIEVNCLNSSGWYECDVSRIVKTVDESQYYESQH
jgi:ATP-grasp domain, R2K clade family 3